MKLGDNILPILYTVKYITILHTAYFHIFPKNILNEIIFLENQNIIIIPMYSAATDVINAPNDCNLGIRICEIGRIAAKSQTGNPESEYYGWSFLFWVA